MGTTNIAVPEISVPEAKKWVENMARAGYAAKGSVYILVGILAFVAAVGLGGSIAGPKEALEVLRSKTFGKTLVLVIALGLACYAMWRWVQSILDADNRGKKPKGLAMRGAYAVSGLIHIALAWAVFKMAMGRSEGGDNSEAGLTAKLMAQPFGIWLVGIVGLIIGGIAVFHIARGWKGSFKKRLDFSKVNQKFCDILCRTCQFGLIARGITFLIISWFFIRAAKNYNPQEAGGLSDALHKVASQPYGPWLLAVMGLGLVAYGIHALVEARFRRIRI